MNKVICDICGNDIGCKSLKLPAFLKIYGGVGNKVLATTHDIMLEDVDVCCTCQHALADFVSSMRRK